MFVSKHRSPRSTKHPSTDRFKKLAIFVDCDHTGCAFLGKTVVVPFSERFLRRRLCYELDRLCAKGLIPRVIHSTPRTPREPNQQRVMVDRRGVAEEDHVILRNCTLLDPPANSHVEQVIFEVVWDQNRVVRGVLRREF
jgi:hypothetical protein